MPVTFIFVKPFHHIDKYFSSYIALVPLLPPRPGGNKNKLSTIWMESFPNKQTLKKEDIIEQLADLIFIYC